MIAKPELPDYSPETSGSTVFPEFRGGLYKLVENEVRGLTPEQLNWTSEEYTWSREWGIQQRAGHLTVGAWSWANNTILLDRHFPDGLPAELSELDVIGLTEHTPSELVLDPRIFSTIDDVLRIMGKSLDLYQAFLEGETYGSLRDTPVQFQGSILSSETLFPKGSISEDLNDSEKALGTLYALFLQRKLHYGSMVWDMRRQKHAQGLTEELIVPKFGYQYRSGWDNDMVASPPK